VTDGGPPSNEGRGYVLRRILRRAVRHARQTLGVRGPLLCDLVPAVVESIGHAFPELKDKPDKVGAVIRDEEQGFLKTLDFGLAHFDFVAISAFMKTYGDEHGLEPDGSSRGRKDDPLLPEGWTAYFKRNDRRSSVALGNFTKREVGRHVSSAPTISGNDAFGLHDTFGFPIDLTRVMAQERGMTVDEAGFEKLMNEARERSRGAGRGLNDPFDVLAGSVCDDSFKYDEPFECAAQIRSIARHTKPFDTDSAKLGEEIVFSTNCTPFYAEQGGQVSDTGTVHTDDGEIVVTQVHQRGQHIVHIGRVTKGEIVRGRSCQMKVDRPRRVSIMKNHTATHLLNFALRAVIGPEEDQKGSLVAPDRLRFDFSCSHAMTDEQVEQTERLVNADIEQDLEVFAEVVPLAQARSIAGVRALFGEKYPDPVRVVAIGVPLAEVLKDPGNEQWNEFSIELCGGTHLPQTGEAKQLVIIQEQALAAGVRRITALTGQAAHDAQAVGRELEARTRRAAELGDDELLNEFNEITARLQGLTIGAVVRGRIDALLGLARDRVKRIHKHAQAQTRAGAVDQARRIVSATAGPIIVEQLSGTDHDSLLSAMDVIRAKHIDTAVMLFGTDEAESKVSIVARVPQALIDRGLKAGDWVREAAKACGGRGGGRADMAQAGAKNPDMVPQAITAAKAFAEQKLK
ncbi:MAG: hypothetical protein IH889_06725, partial [Planctomycetes bacterium]|nr:hypothetical protein [Planctomycetota bacterium]